MMNRRAFIGVMAGGLLPTPLVAQAQPGAKVVRIGYLDGSSPSARTTLLAAFKDGLRDRGYAPSQYVIDSRYAEGYDDRLPELAADLVGDKPDVILAVGAFRSWVYRITAHAACRKRRSQRSERSAVPWEGIGPTVDETGKQMQQGFDWSLRLKDPAIQVELQSVLRAAIDELPAEHRTTFVLHDIDGLSSLEIAETLQIKGAIVKSQVHRARLILRSRLASYVGHTPSSTRAPELEAGKNGNGTATRRSNRPARQA